ncbi:hypothetical protein D3248_13380 [Leucobacter zeae]|nr:hypothetical protein [Leucobacter zeae]
MRLVDEFFDGVFAPLEAWLPDLAERLTERLTHGRMTGPQLAEFVRADADRILDQRSRPLYGAGYCASDLVVHEGNPLAWWQGADRLLLGASMFGPGQAAIDLVRLEWYRVPESTGRRHVAGPFVDYLCSNEITITSSMPVDIDGRFGGVICADVLVASLEEALLPRISEFADATLVNASGRVVVSSDPDYETGDRYPGADPELGIEALDAPRRIVSSERYPFSLIAAA